MFKFVSQSVYRVKPVSMYIILLIPLKQNEAKISSSANWLTLPSPTLALTYAFSSFFPSGLVYMISDLQFDSLYCLTGGILFCLLYSDNIDENESGENHLVYF